MPRHAAPMSQLATSLAASDRRPYPTSRQPYEDARIEPEPRTGRKPCVRRASALLLSVRYWGIPWFPRPLLDPEGTPARICLSRGARRSRGSTLRTGPSVRRGPMETATMGERRRSRRSTMNTAGSTYEVCPRTPRLTWWAKPPLPPLTASHTSTALRSKSCATLVRSGLRGLPRLANQDRGRQAAGHTQPGGGRGLETRHLRLASRIRGNRRRRLRRRAPRRRRVQPVAPWEPRWEPRGRMVRIGVSGFGRGAGHRPSVRTGSDGASDRLGIYGSEG